MQKKPKSPQAAAVERYHARLVRIDLRIDPELMRAVSDAAAMRGMSRTAYIIRALEQQLERDDAPCGRV